MGGRGQQPMNSPAKRAKRVECSAMPTQPACISLDVLGQKSLRQRVRIAKQGSCLPDRPVLYWNRKTLRGHHNPALDTAITAANALGAPLLVLIHIAEDRQPHATARRLQFLLEGVRSTLTQLKKRGITAAFHLTRPGHRQPAHLSLAHRAALVITEEPFCDPYIAGLSDLCASQISAPVWVADCDCIVPVSLTPAGSCHRAYAYEKAVKNHFATFAAEGWTDATLDEASMSQSAEQLKNLPFVPVDLESCDPQGLAALVSECQVDHSVAAVSQYTTGGSEAGYRRWCAFKANGLVTYARRRNDAMDVSGPSRMSAYLNAGMVSPMRMAHDVWTSAGAGKAKFLNEYFVWRGLSYAWCYHKASQGVTLNSLPRWAQVTLEKHRSDGRKPIPLEVLRAGSSGNQVWDAMQQYLVHTGELHNNARMGWGKAILKWTASPEEALQVLADLNNRYALDGHSPPSYGGLLGCLGLFEGPKSESPIYGTISQKALKAKYARLSPSLLDKTQGLSTYFTSPKQVNTTLCK